MQILLRGNRLQRARLVSGLVLFAFALTHFLNHAIGLVSLETMHEMQLWRTMVTRSWPGTIVLLAALATHMVLGLWRLAERRTLSMPPWELTQIGLGILIPFLLLPHIVNTRIARVFFDVQDSYLYELARLWPASAILQSTLLLVVWIHGCIGLHFWLRLYSPYRALAPALLLAAIAIPLAAVAGFMTSGRAVASLVEDPAMLAQVKELTRWPSEAGNVRLGEIRGWTRLGFGAAVGLVIAWLALQWARRLSGGKVTVRYVGGPTIETPPGATLLEISRMSAIPHASVCGGRARCSTCRVRVDETFAALPPPSFAEAITLGAIQAPENVRLACQIRPTAEITVTRLLRPGTAGPRSVELEEMDAGGVERQLAVLHVNMRDFGELSRRKLPYDVVFMLNVFFRATGNAITANGGLVDRIAGDSLTAVFGQRQGLEAGCRQALRAARAIDLALDHINAAMSAELAKPLRVGMGLHAGTMLLGRVGYGEAVDLTAIGPAVNVARALEEATKSLGCQIAMTEEVAQLAGWPEAEKLSAPLDIGAAGDGDPVRIIKLTRGRDLPASLLGRQGGAFGQPEGDPMPAA